MSVYLTPVGHALGERYETVAEAAANGRLYSDPGVLCAAGFHGHYLAGPKTDACELACRASADLRASVDLIVFATALPDGAARCDEGRFRATGDVRWLMDYSGSRLQIEFGSNAPVIGVGQQACTGALGAIRIARSLVLSGEANAALCVTADRFPAGARYEQAYNLISDGAAACLVTRAEGPFRILGGHHITEGSHALAAADVTVGSYFAYTTETVRKACAEQRAPGWLVTQNTHANANRLLGSLLGIDPCQVQAPTRAEVGHVISADCLINLHAIAPSIPAGDVVALTMAGYGANWQSIVLEAVK